MLCASCAGAHGEQLCELLICLDCRVAGAASGGGTASQTRHYMDLVVAMRDLGRRESTQYTHGRGVQDYRRFCALRGVVGFPATIFDLEAYVVHSIHVRRPRLDTSTIRTHLTGLSTWHELARAALGLPLLNPRKTAAARSFLSIADKNFKLESKAMEGLSYEEWRGVLDRGFTDTRSGRQRKLFFVLCTVGPLRPAAAAHLVVVYELRAGGGVSYGDDSQIEVVGGSPDWAARHLLIHLGKGNARADKNVDAMHTRSIPVPHKMLGCRPVDLFEDYLREEKPPSGGYLLSAPLGAVGFRTTAYTLACKSVKDAYLRAHPAAPPARLTHVGGSSPRKSFSQWMWDEGVDRRKISDMGGWRIKREGVDYYFSTSRGQMLQYKHTLHAQRAARLTKEA